MSKIILLADDSLTIQKVVELTFSDTDFEVVATSSGDELLEKLPSSGADIIICDTIMPGTDGYSVCQAIKSDPASLHLPVVLMTGTFEPFDRDRALAAGCSEIITKPFEAKHLVETVERLVSGEGAAAAPTQEAVEGAVAPPAIEGTVAPPEFEGSVRPPTAPPAAVPPPAAPVGDEFGTMLSAPPEAAQPAEPVSDEAPEDALDFTSTGFAEMEAAAHEAVTTEPEAPAHGLDFEPAEVGDEPVSHEPTQPISRSVVEDATDPFAASTPGVFGEAPTPEEPVGVAEEPAFDAQRAEASPPEVDDAVEISIENSDQFVVEPATDQDAETPESEFDTAPEEAFEQPSEQPEPQSGFDIASDQLFEPAPETAEPEPEVGIEAIDVSPSTLPEETPIEETPAAPVGFAVETEPAAELVEASPAAFAASEEVTKDDEDIVGRLDDEDIDRIARRVIELFADRMEKIAWDVIPDMAEIVVRERLREIEDEIERSGGAEPN